MSNSEKESRRTRLLYILGSGRNGSTLLAMILASAPGAMTVGELHWLWDRGLVENRLCGCGVPTRDCPYWTNVLEQRTAIGMNAGDRIALLRNAALSGFRPFRLLSGNWQATATQEQHEFMSVLSDVYGHITTDDALIIDSSKRPTYGLLLSRIDSLDVRVVHLVRDSRAVAFSWLRKKLNPDIPGGGFMKRHNAAMTSAGWNVWNLLSEWLWRKSRDRYLRVRYEDLVADPQGTITRIAMFADIDPDAYRFQETDTVEVCVSHTISGNPGRFSSGAVKLQSDDEWKQRMRRRDMWLTTLLTWPELVRYGYRLRIHHETPTATSD